MNTAPQQTTVFRLIVTGGGTGGHTYPALTAIRTLQARLATSGRTLDVLWIGTAEGLEARVTSAEGIPFTTVATGKIRRSSNPLKMVSCGQRPGHGARTDRGRPGAQRRLGLPA